MNFDIKQLMDAASFKPLSLQHPNAWCGHLPFASWIIRVLNPKIFVELGTHTGNSYFSFCQSASEARTSTKCYAVDTWQGDEHAGQYGEQVYNFVNSYNDANYSAFSRLLRMTFDEALSYFSDASIELLHIDGLHTYEAVKHDFESWLPKLAPNAVVLFHDTNVRERGFGVWRLWEELERIYPNNLEFKNSHGLGVLQLSDTTELGKLSWLASEPSVAKMSLIAYFSELGAKELVRFSLAQAQQELIQRDSQLAGLNRMVSERDSQLADLNRMVSDRDSQLADLNRMVSERDSQLVDLNQMVSDRDIKIARLAEEIMLIQASTSWQITAPFRNVVRKLR